MRVRLFDLVLVVRDEKALRICQISNCEVGSAMLLATFYSHWVRLFENGANREAGEQAVHERSHSNGFIWAFVFQLHQQTSYYFF